MSLPKVSPATVTSLALGKRAPNGPRVLLADDDPLMRELLSEILDWDGYRVDTAEDGAMAWEKIKAARDTSENYTLLITDNAMPKLSGIGLAEKVRDAEMPLPVVMVCGMQPENTTKVPITAVLLKPFTADVLLATVRNVLKEHGSVPGIQPDSPSVDARDVRRQTKS
jgi:DNA-binding response OmpR family regulator